MMVILFGLLSMLMPAAPPAANRPDTPVLLRSSLLTVTIDRRNGLPAAYRIKGGLIRGMDPDQKMTATICRLSPRAYFSVPVSLRDIQASIDKADLLFAASLDGQPAATFHIKYAVDGPALNISMEQVNEQQGFELIENSMVNLATVREEDGPGWLAHGMNGGEVVDLQHAKPGAIPGNSFFGKIGYVLPVAMVGTAKAECIMEVSAFMDGTMIEIAGNKDHRHARIGTLQVYRVHGGRSYNMNDGTPPNAGNESTPNLLVGQSPRCRLNFISDVDVKGSPDWLDGAKVIASRMPRIPTSYFNDKFIYLVGGKYKKEKEPRTSFAQSEKLIHDIAMLTDFAPQVALISGWAYDGQDTGFPSEDSVNSSLGGYQGLIQLMGMGKNYNANISLNTNYDDAYRSSPIFDTAFIARRPDGHIWKSQDWAGDTSYIIGMAKYMKKWGMQRIDYAMEHYPIHDAILIDAMSWHSIRNDWDLDHPASGYKNLAEGKFPIIDAFAKRGIRVMSEQLRYPFIGKLAVTADGSGGGECSFGGEPVPLLAAIYRQSAIWGAGEFSLKDVKNNFFWNCRPMPWYVSNTDRKDIMEFYYLTVLPYNKLHDRNMENYEKYGYTSRIGLGTGYKIEVDWMQNDYSIVADGVEIAGHFATFCPLDENRIACYARSDEQLDIPLPKGWEAGKVVARALYVDHRMPAPIEVENNRIRLSVEAGRPVIVYRNAAIADRAR